MAAASAVLLTLSLLGSVQAADTLDQSVPTPGIIPQSSAILGMQQMAETFTPAMSGQMDRVSLYVGSSNFNRPSFRLEIWTVDTSQTTLAAVGATPGYQLQAATAKSWQSFDLVPSVFVQSGRQYALVVTQTSFPLILRWGFMAGWDYAGGNMWLCCGWTKDATRNFAFQTFVQSASTPPPSPSPVVNRPPTLGAPAAAAVRAPEGTAPSNTGAYSDPDGDAVEISASTGTVTQTAHSWTWTQPASDEGPAQTVTITASDHHNAAVGLNFTVEVYAAPPTAVITPTGAAATHLAATSAINEGTQLSFWGGGHSLSAEDNAAGFAYAWSVTKDGAAYPAAGTGYQFTFAPDDEGAYVVTLRATDDGGMTGTATMPVNVVDVLPTATITAVIPALSAPKIVVPNEVVTFAGTFTDPGTADTHTATWAFGDSSSASGWSVSHYYTAPGVYTVTLTVAQGDDPGVGTATTTVTVLSPSDALGQIGQYVQTLPELTAGQRQSLVAKLDGAAAAAARGDVKAAGNQLNAFLNELQADVKTGKVSPEQGAILIADVTAIKAALGSYNRFLDLWPIGL
jgi:PKD domain